MKKYSVVIQRTQYERTTLDVDAKSMVGAKRIVENLITNQTLFTKLAKQRTDKWEFAGSEIIPVKARRV